MRKPLQPLGIRGALLTANIFMKLQIGIVLILTYGDFINTYWNLKLYDLTK